MITLTNAGFAAVNVSGHHPWRRQRLGVPDRQCAPTTIPAGGSVQVTVRFIGHDPVDDNAAVLFKGTLTVDSDAFGGPQGHPARRPGAVSSPRAARSRRSRRSSRPSATRTDTGGAQLNNNGVVETIGDEVLMPYLERLDGSKPIEVIQIAAFLQQTNVARLSLHEIGNGDHQDPALRPGRPAGPDRAARRADDRGRATPAASRGRRSTATRRSGSTSRVDGRPTFISWSDPEANDLDANIGSLFVDGQGHLIRFFQAKDAAGNVIPGTYIGIQDYPGAGNYDYNDHMFIIKNVKAHELTAAEDANGNDINDALEQDSDGDGILNFFDPSNVPPSAQRRATSAVPRRTSPAARLPMIRCSPCRF